MVHPDFRHRGIGTALVSWSITEARTLFAPERGDGAKTVYLNSEFMSDEAVRLYERYGFAPNSVAHVMRRDLQLVLPETNFPGGITIAEWKDELAPDFFEAYQTAFRDRPGFPGWSAEFWISRAEDDPDFSPERSLVAYARGQPVGFITCFKDYVGQMGVRPEWRNRGLGSALLVEILHRVARAGENAVWLEVNANNPTATRVYRRLGFDIVGRRGSYVLTLQ
jgi:mycothiol synthase